MTDLDDNLKIEEYKYVREMIKTNIDIMEKNESLILLSIAAIYGFFLKDFTGSSNIAQLSFAVPVALSIFGFVRYRGLDEIIKIHNDYLVKLEVQHQSIIGWTTFYRAEIALQGRSTLKDSRNKFWWTLMIGSSVLFVLLNIKPFLEFLCK